MNIALQKHKHFYKFERDSYISMEKEEHWSNNYLSNSIVNPNIMKKFESNNLKDDAFMLGIISFFY
uniref:Uncharacterized protein n=1 Tax=Strongyloides papillosus TaxID=174720 RepID=A0A0N5BFS4_STREA